MSDYPKSLPVPHALLYYRSCIRVICQAGEKSVESMSGVGTVINLPKGFDCKPLVKVQAVGPNMLDDGPCWSFDYEADQGRGVWVLYDITLHKIPGIIDESESLPDADPSDYVAQYETLAEQYEPKSSDAPSDDDKAPDCNHEDCICDEPSDDEDLDEDDDEDEIAG